MKFATKPQIALSQIEAALKAGVARGVVLADAGYGVDGAFRARLTALGLTYAVGVQPTLSVWPPGEAPLPPKPWSGKGRPPSRVRRDDDHRPLSAKASRCDCPPRPGPGGMARGLQPDLVFAFCRGSCQAGVARPQTRHAASGRMVGHRMARGRGGADEILALHLA